MARFVPRDIVEVYEDQIEASTNEEQRQHYRSELKQRWPGMACYYPEPDWDKRDLVNLYEDNSFEGLLTETPEAKKFSKVPKDQTTVYRSYLKHSKRDGKVSVHEEVERCWKGTIRSDPIR